MEHSNDPHSNIRENILRKIRSKEIDMRPGSYFTLKIALLIGLTFLVFGISVFLFSFIAFIIRVSHHNELLGFGPSGIALFVHEFPWYLFLLDLALLGLLEHLLRKFSFGYRSSMLYLLLITVITITASGFALDRGTRLNDQLLDRAEKERLPRTIGTIYKTARRSAKGGVCTCTVLEVREGSLIVYDNHIGTTTEILVLVPPNNPNATTSGIVRGDTIFIAGIKRDADVEAFGITRLRVPR